MTKVAILSVLSVFSVLCQNTSLWADDSMHFVHLRAENVQERSQIAQYIHIDQIIEEDVYATLSSYDLSVLKAFQEDKIVESHPLALDQESDLRSLNNDVYDFPNDDDIYHTYDEVLLTLDDLSTRYPHIVEIYTLGTTVEGREIPMIRITQKQNRDSEFFVPGILFVGSHHAREHLSTEVPLLLAQHLTQNYESDPEIKNLIDSRDIYIVPILNVDGKLYDIKGKKYKWWRKNRSFNKNSSERGVDLNRNYGYGWGTGGSSKSPSSTVYMGPAPFSEPETTAIKNFIESAPNIRILLSFHTYSELILYPWGGSHKEVGGTDQKIFEKMATDMSKWNNYTPQKASDLYIASGDTCDWAYGVHNIYCFTFELSPSGKLFFGGFYPGSEVVDRTFRANIGPSLYLIEYSDNPARVLTRSNYELR